jgi:lysophospholipid acyltransferase
MVTHLILVAQFPFPIIGNKAWIEAHPNHIERFFYTIVAAFTERTKFYFAWKLAESASVFAGFGFEGYEPETGKALGWNGVQNVDIFGVETACNVQNSTRCWNKRTQGWLERYTYSRTNNSLVITYFVSALWHGLYPGFFFFFMFMPVLTTIERGWRAHINPLFLSGYDGRNYSTAPPGIRDVYWILCTIGTYLTISTVVQTFSLGSWENCHNALGSYAYGPYIFWVVLAVVLSVIPTPKKPKEAHAKKVN